MKKLLSLTLALMMLLGLTLPAAAAEETSDAALARVTQTVKETLKLETEDYEEFWGSRYEDGLTGIWSLSWSGADGDLSIEALDDGTVLSYRLSQTYNSYHTFPTFPRGTRTPPPGRRGTFWTRSWARTSRWSWRNPLAWTA